MGTRQYDETAYENSATAIALSRAQIRERAARLKALNATPYPVGTPYGAPDITELKVLGGRRIWLEYADGTAAEVDLMRDDLINTGLCFAPLREDDELFRQVYIRWDTIAWPGNIDIAPELLYEATLENSLLTAGLLAA